MTKMNFADPSLMGLSFVEAVLTSDVDTMESIRDVIDTEELINGLALIAGLAMASWANKDGVKYQNVIQLLREEILAASVQNDIDTP